MSTILVFAQEESADGFLFPQYTQGYAVLQENNTKISSRFNYDTVEEKMLFLDEDEGVMELSASEILIVVIGERSFFPAEKGAFYERISLSDDHSFFIRWKTKILSEGKAAGYGSYSGTASVGSVGFIPSGGGLQQLTNDERFREKFEQDYFLKNGKKLVKFNSTKTLGKLFKNHKAEMENFAKENNTDFSKPEDVKAILEYAFSLPKNK
jgi:hypothetical protein